MPRTLLKPIQYASSSTAHLLQIKVYVTGASILDGN
jgi:hypothetical protein